MFLQKKPHYKQAQFDSQNRLKITFESELFKKNINRNTKQQRNSRQNPTKGTIKTPKRTIYNAISIGVK